MTARGHAGQETVRRALFDVHELLARRGIRHALAYGTLLGAVRSGDLIEWDDDFDLFIDPGSVDELPSLRGELMGAGLAVYRVRRPGHHLAVNPGGVAAFDAGVVAVYRGSRHVGDLFAPAVFSDGVLRRFDFDQQVYWSPHSSFPAFFLEQLGEVEVRGRSLPAPRHPERWLAGVYGDDWRVPYRAVRQGGEPRAGCTIHGDRYEPKLARELAWCAEQGWDAQPYAGCPDWPQPIRGAGPIGPCPRTRGNSNALWWRDVDELRVSF